eukprot:gnl/Hemi2/11110_TR3826_c0_g1_i1.p1 gnl/Hemi2/11110_TR3826_c0_g1~~gnl/Hemi2/11110_TR3826_c0_g1_i1.p1  ORF type:complete len:259 (-),score=68.49 gnl/Hemi2/11110_TR3826_c0_g1_i1:136-912(-)
MKEEVYNAIKTKLFRVSDIEPLIEHEFKDVSFETMFSILSQAYQWMVIHTSHQYKKNIARYATSYNNGKEILEIANTIGFSPYHLARWLLEHLLQKTRQEVSNLVKDPSLIADARLRAEVIECIANDQFCSPGVDRAKHNVGLEYEFILYERLINAKIPFIREQEMRERGYHKTPDVLLEVPIEVRGRCVMWIDSKALFGDQQSHSKSRDQFKGYVNRYGPGMVIYWFDFVESLQSEEPDVLLCRDFPSEFTCRSAPA